LRGGAARRRRRGWPRSWPRSAVVRADSVSDFARIRALGLFDCLDHDAGRRQRTCLFSQCARKRLHELVVDFLTAELGQKAAHLDDVFLVAASLLGALLQHGGKADRTTTAGTWGTTWARRSHAWSRRARAHWPSGARPARTWGTIAAWRANTGRRELRLHLAGPPSATTAASAGGASALTAHLTFAAVFAARNAAAITVEAIVELVRLQIPVDAFASRTCGSATGRRFDDDQRRFVLLGDFGRGEPGLLQRPQLAE
jgi:hypothetical protein